MSGSLDVEVYVECSALSHGKAQQFTVQLLATYTSIQTDSGDLDWVIPWEDGWVQRMGLNHQNSVSLLYYNF